MQCSTCYPEYLRGLIDDSILPARRPPPPPPPVLPPPGDDGDAMDIDEPRQPPRPPLPPPPRGAGLLNRVNIASAFLILSFSIIIVYFNVYRSESALRAHGKKYITRLGGNKLRPMISKHSSLVIPGQKSFSLNLCSNLRSSWQIP